MKLIASNRKFRVLLVAGLLLILILILWVAPAMAITWGERDTEHDNVGAFMIDHPTYGPYQICSGTLVHPQVFLTAGHCTFFVEEIGWDYWVSFDEDVSVGSNPNLLDVKDIVTHPDYWTGNQNSNAPLPASRGYDAGVLILAEPVTDIEPANLPYEGFLDDLRNAGMLKHGSDRAKFTVVGYGGTLEWPPPSIEYFDQRQYAYSEYQTLLKSWLRVSQNQATGNGGSCYGDSGGPSFWTEPDGTEILVGITSWGDMVCVATGFNYRVDIPDTLNFIADVIESL